MVPDGALLTTFLGASLVLAIVPGPAVLYIVARGVHQGRGAGLASALGVGAGGLVHVFGAAVGLSALLASSAAAFTVVKLLGSAYLVGLGLHTLLGRGRARPVDARRPRRPAVLFAQGALVQVLNPKVALFFLAFLPQFVSPAAGGVTVQLLLLGTGFVAIALCTDAAYALLAGSLRGWGRDGASVRAPRIAAGTVYVGIGVAAAFTGDGS